MERTEFVKQTAHMLQRVYALDEMAKKEGLLALEAAIDRPEKERRDILEYGLWFVADGTEPEVIKGILSDLIAQEAGEDERRLKEMQKEAVLSVQAGENTKILLYKLMSHLSEDELKSVQESLPDTFMAWSVGAPDKEKKDFPELAAQAITKLIEFSGKAGREGLLSLEEDLKNLDDVFLKDALRLVIDFTTDETIDTLLSNRIAMEQDDEKRRLKTMQKEAALYIKGGYNSRMILLLLMSRIKSEEFGTVRKLLPDTDFFNDILGAVDARAAKPSNKKKKEFLELAAQTVMNAAALTRKAKKEGILALQDDLEELDDKFLQEGMHLVLDGTGAGIIDRLLSNQIALEQDEEARRLKTIQKEAVLAMQAGENAGLMLHKQLSHIDNFELEALWKAHPDIFEGLSEKFPCGGVEAPDEEVTGFVKRLARVVRKACEFSDKARGEGLLALKEVIDESKAERRDIFEYGSQLAADGWGSLPDCPIDSILSTLISHNCDEETRRLKRIQKEAVLGIQAGENTRLLLHILLSHIDNAELEALRRSLSYAYISEEFPGRDDTEDEEATGFARRLAHIAQRACEFSDKARGEGLLALDDILNEEKAERRDIFEYGIQLMVNGTDSSVTKKILSNMVNLEQDNEKRRLMEVQKEAVLCIYAGLHPIEFLHILVSKITNTELEALLESAPDIFKMFHYEGAENAKEAGGEKMLPEKSFWILKGVKDALEKSLGSEKAVDITSRLASSLTEGEDPSVAGKINASIIMFEDILMLDDLCIQKVLRETDNQELAAALRGMDTVVQNRIFRNMSGRAVAILKDRIGSAEPVKQKDEEIPVQKLETFEDIIMLDDKNIQKLLLELDSGELGKALKNANAPIQDKIFKNMSRRNAATIKREIENMTGTVNRKNAEEAQKKVIAIIRHLADTGEIVISGTFDDSDIKEARQKVISLILRLADSGGIVFSH